MNNLPIEISEEVLLNINPEKIFVLCSINKLYNRICNRDSFWRRYYKRWVNSEYEIYKELKVNGRWREAFLRNYSKIIYINFNTTRKNDMWNIEETGDHSSPTQPSYNFYCIERKDNILKCVPVLPLGLRTGINPSTMHMIIPRMTLVDEKLKIMGHYDYITRDNLTINTEHLDGMNVLVYPLHHYIIIDINEIPSYKTYTPENIYESTSRGYSLYGEPLHMSRIKNKGYLLNNGKWSFDEINIVKYLDNTYLKKIKGVKLVIPS